MHDVIMKEKEEDPKFKRTTFIVTPQASDIPVGCESISEEYVIQVNEIVDQMVLVNDFATYALDPAYPIAEDIEAYLTCNNDAFAAYCP